MWCCEVCDDGLIRCVHQSSFSLMIISSCFQLSQSFSPNQEAKLSQKVMTFFFSAALPVCHALASRGRSVVVHFRLKVLPTETCQSALSETTAVTRECTRAQLRHTVSLSVHGEFAAISNLSGSMSSSFHSLIDLLIY